MTPTKKRRSTKVPRIRVRRIHFINIYIDGNGVKLGPFSCPHMASRTAGELVGQYRGLGRDVMTAHERFERDMKRRIKLDMAKAGMINESNQD